MTQRAARSLWPTGARGICNLCVQLHSLFPLRGLFNHVVMITVGSVKGNLESTACFMLSVGGHGKLAFMLYKYIYDNNVVLYGITVFVEVESMFCVMLHPSF